MSESQLSERKDNYLLSCDGDFCQKYINQCFITIWEGVRKGEGQREEVREKVEDVPVDQSYINTVHIMSPCRCCLATGILLSKFSLPVLCAVG